MAPRGHALLFEAGGECCERFGERSVEDRSVCAAVAEIAGSRSDARVADPVVVVLRGWAVRLRRPRIEGQREFDRFG